MIVDELWIESEFAPFYRRWSGVPGPWWLFPLNVAWWAWPIRWVFVRESARNRTVIRDYHLSASSAAAAMARYAASRGLPVSKECP